MASGAYSFIDISVLDEVRRHFAAGSPLVLVNEALDTVLWANGPGASLLGFADVEAAMGSQFDVGKIVRRQIAGIRGFPRIGRGRSVFIRLERGFRSHALACEASNVALPDGANAILLAVPGTGPQGRSDTQIAARAISGIGNTGHFAAVLDDKGAVLAESKGYSDLGIARETIGALIRQVDAERDRLVKRMIPAAQGDVAAGIGRLADDPAQHLLVIVTGSEDRKDYIEGEAQQPAGPGAGVAGAGAPDRSNAEPDDGGDGEPGPLRFSWKTDAAGRISFISESFGAEFASAASSMIGHSFSDIAERFGIDRSGEISGLLERRDTWSGRTVFWPIEGTDRMVPVDLAALPTYSRDRVFEGFRGFGVARLNETVPDPERRGLSLRRSSETTAAEEPRPRAASPEKPAPHRDIPANDPFRGEKPAIRRNTPGPAEDDKIIRLAARRRSTERRLSDSERSAFQEIAERLRRETSEAEATATPARISEPAGHRPARARTTGGDSMPTTEQPAAGRGEGARGEPSQAVAIARSGFLPSAFATAGSNIRADADISVLEQMPTAILIRSRDMLQYANPEFFRLTGYDSIEDLADAGGFDVLFAEPERLEEEENGGRRHAMRLVTRSGAVEHCEALLRSVRWEGRRALMLAIRPVFDHNSALKARVEELSTILDTATDGVVLIDTEGTIRSISRPAEALFGFETEELQGKPFTSLFAVESQRSAGDYLAGLTGNGVASVLNDGREVIGREAQGRFIPLFMTIGKLPGRGGFCAVMRDITPWKRAEEELNQARGQAERASSQKTDFLARISHEIRTPLNAIIGFSELMMDEKFGPIGNERYRDYLRDINRSGNHVLDLVNDLLDISKIEAGEQDLKFQAVSLNDALADGVAMMQPEANRERVIIRSSFASNLPDVVADLRSIKQIALNLLSNAIRFTPAGGQVIVSTVLESSGDVVLRVRDTGIGMSRSEIEQALRPFKQISQLKHRRDGTGLGLPLTKALVEANRARFAIDSTPDEGTIVEITFPSTRVLAE